MADVPFATAEEATRAFTKVITVETPDGPRAYEIRKQTPGDRRQLREECLDPISGQVDTVAANIVATHLMVVRPALDMEQAAALPEVVFDQLVVAISEHSSRTVEQMTQPEETEGAEEARQFPVPTEGPSGDAALAEVAAAEGAQGAQSVDGPVAD